MILINVAKDYTNAPGGRYIKEGKYSGEEFRDTILDPKFKEAEATGEKIQINLDGCFGYPSSFLDEAFRGIAKKYGVKFTLNVLEFICEDQPGLENEIRKCVEAAENK